MDRKCLLCGWLITIPPFGLGECSIHEAAHQQKEYCQDWTLLKRENAYCNPKCAMNGRLMRERQPNQVAPCIETRNISEYPIGAAVKNELDVDENVAGALIYFITEKSGQYVSVVKLNPVTRTRIADRVIGSMSVCAV